jgi:adenylate cyclase
VAAGNELWEKAIVLDPQYAEVYARLSFTYWVDWFYQWNQDPQNLKRAFELAQKAIALDGALPMPRQVLGLFYLVGKQHVQAKTETERAITLDPNYADSYRTLGDILSFAGRPEEAIELCEKTIRLNPRHPAWYPNSLGFAYLLTGQCEQAIAALKRAPNLNPNFPPIHLNLAIAYSESGREEEARAEVAEFLRLVPNASFEVGKQRAPIKDPAVLERYFSALRKAGLQ